VKNGFILPTKNYLESEFKINIVKEKTIINHTPYFLSNSFGFGGNNISAVIEVI
jgi:3-oxoacyl-(acyl-carrier-protein) synthase